jgi:hypothetical protein
LGRPGRRSEDNLERGLERFVVGGDDDDLVDVTLELRDGLGKDLARYTAVGSSRRSSFLSVQRNARRGRTQGDCLSRLSSHLRPVSC